MTCARTAATAVAGVALAAAAFFASPVRTPAAAAAAPAHAMPLAAPTAYLATAVLAGGCFWGLDAVFERVRGVRDVTVGYSGGDASTATYEQVSTGSTGHAESVRIAYDPAVVSYKTLLDVYFRVAHDPTQLDRQAPDDGPQYRSEIFYATPAQKAAAAAEIASLTRSHAFGSPIATLVAPLHAFYAAEAYHQHYAARNPQNPYIVEVDEPRLAALQSTFPALMKHG